MAHFLKLYVFRFAAEIQVFLSAIITLDVNVLVQCTKNSLPVYQYLLYARTYKATLTDICV
jgi:hypothetical protein